MSATQTELLEERWSVLMRDVETFREDAGDITSVHSKRWRRINETMREVVAMLVDEVHQNEVDSLDVATEAAWKCIKRELLTWAEMIEDGRALYREAHLGGEAA